MTNNVWAAISQSEFILIAWWTDKLQCCAVVARPSQTFYDNFRNKCFTCTCMRRPGSDSPTVFSLAPR